jgi:putative tricarboxylic transport membrane protein
MTRTMFALLAGVSLGALASSPAKADWPDEERVITMLVPFAAGGGTDLVFRALVEELDPLLPARVQISNVGGAGSAVGTNEVLSLPADGYTLLGSGTHTVGATMQGLTEGYLELEHVVGLNWDPFILAVLASRPWETFADLVEAAEAAPGTICLGNAGIGGATGIATIGINLAFDNVFNVTPYEGGAELRVEVLGGRCEVGVFSQSEMLANREDLTPLAILYDERSRLEGLDQVPTLGELGYGDLDVPGGSYRSISVRAGTPDDVKQILAEAVQQAFESEGYQAFMVDSGLIPAFTGPADTEAYFQRLIEGYEPILTEAGLYNR